MTLEELNNMIAELAVEKQWGSKPDDINFGEKISLVHAEISEALEAYRQHNIDGKDGVAEELADAIIRIIHLAGVYNVNLEKEIINKIEVNKNRNWSDDKFYQDRK